MILGAASTGLTYPRRVVHPIDPGAAGPVLVAICGRLRACWTADERGPRELDGERHVSVVLPWTSPSGCTMFGCRTCGQTAKATGGKCRGVAPDDPWLLSTLVREVMDRGVVYALDEQGLLAPRAS